MADIKLRAPEPVDIDTLFIWENDSSQWISSLTPVHVSRQRIWDYVNNFDGDIGVWQQIKLIVCNEGETLGSVDLYDIDLRTLHAFVGIFIAQEFRGKGFGAESLRQICDYAFNVLGLKSLCAVVAVNNVPALHIFGVAGFSEVGILHDWLRNGQSLEDAILLQLVSR